MSARTRVTAPRRVPRDVARLDDAELRRDLHRLLVDAALDRAGLSLAMLQEPSPAAMVAATKESTGGEELARCRG